MQHAIRVSSFFGNELILGSFTIKLLPIALAFLFFVKQNKTKQNNHFFNLINFFKFCNSLIKC